MEFPGMLPVHDEVEFVTPIDFSAVASTAEELRALRRQHDATFNIPPELMDNADSGTAAMARYDLASFRLGEKALMDYRLQSR